MHSNFIIDIDIQEEGEKAENMINQIREIINEHRGLPLNEKSDFQGVLKKNSKRSLKRSKRIKKRDA